MRTRRTMTAPTMIQPTARRGGYGGSTQNTGDLLESEEDLGEAEQSIPVRGGGGGGSSSISTRRAPATATSQPRRPIRLSTSAGGIGGSLLHQPAQKPTTAATTSTPHRRRRLRALRDPPRSHDRPRARRAADLPHGGADQGPSDQPQRARHLRRAGGRGEGVQAGDPRAAVRGRVAGRGGRRRDIGDTGGQANEQEGGRDRAKLEQGEEALLQAAG
ncbi:hypothetical protein DFJ73DRAFT_51176 [Zopfochytrium polystomum]|nr:hypothetical protein DFJ73DRAFT_51176 [Zopfochytrium polystomum]